MGVAWCQSAYHGTGRPSRKKPPVDPPSGSSTAHTTDAAPSRTGRPPGPPMSVATQPGHTELISIRSRRSSAASIRVSALSATLLTAYAGAPAPMLARDPASEGR